MRITVARYAYPRRALESAIWARLKLAIRSRKLEHRIRGGEIALSWPDVLGVVRELGSKATQKSINFRFRPEGVAAAKLRSFSEELRKVRAQRLQLETSLAPEEIRRRLRLAGFSKRELKDFPT